MKKIFVERKGVGERTGTQPYDVGLKQKIIKQYLKGDKSFAMLGKEYSINPGILSRWVRVVKFGQPIKKRKEKLSKFTGMSRKTIKPEELAAENKLLKKQLEEEQLKTLIYQKMIEIAERDYKLDIIKKYGVKRSLRSGK